MLIFQKKTCKERLLCFRLLLILKPCYNYHCMFVPVHVYTLKKCLFSFFLHIEAKLSLKMRGYPQFSFWISIAPDMIYLSHIVMIWGKYFLLVGTVLSSTQNRTPPRLPRLNHGYTREYRRLKKGAVQRQRQNTKGSNRLGLKPSCNCPVP